MDRLIMDLAHRLKNPLVSIRTFAHLFKERANDTQFQKDFYETMRQEVERIDDLIDQLIEFSELPDPFVAFHPILPIVEEAVKKANDQLRRIDIHLEQNLHGPSPTLLLDKDQFIYALTHLLAGLGSCLPKPAHAKTPKTQISVRLQSATDTDGVEVRIESNASLFQDRTQFLGLELFIAKRIIERQQGVVQWEISPQGQTSVRILFPGSRPVVSDQKLDPWKQTVPAYAERRKKQLVIAFRDRRSRQRRLYTRSTYFPDRRRTVPATAQ
jgi:signal transduction histidine kinase